MSLSHYEVAIIGGGVSGTALMYSLAKYTTLSSVVLFEKYDELAPLNSNALGNSQTLHSGDIETNYSIDKAAKVKTTAQMLENYAKIYGYTNRFMFKIPKMVLGVGEEEIVYLRKRYNEFKILYPYLEFYEESYLLELEPMLLQDRREPIVAMGTREKYSAVNFGEISKTFVFNAQELKENFDVKLNTKIERIEKKGNIYHVRTKDKIFTADFVVVDAGVHSLMFAHNMGYGLEYSSLPIGGSFFYSKKEFIHSKVYTIQHPKLPFASVHGDPDLVAENRVRFGPTALALPKLERYHNIRYQEVFDAIKPDMDLVKSICDIFKDSDIRHYIMKNTFFELPIIREQLFVKEVQKIIPSIKAEDLEYAHGVGGLRPQIIDKKTHQLLLGEAKIDTGEGIIFNMTPSPGATSCLNNAMNDLKVICHYLEKELDEELLCAELLCSDYPLCSG